MTVSGTTPATTARSSAMSTTDIKARIEAMFADREILTAPKLDPAVDVGGRR